MFRDLVMVLNMADWMGVSLVSVSVCAVLSDVVAGTGTSFDSTSLSTSSFRTRPSLPVPVMSRMLMPCVLRRPRTAGVARDACFDRGLTGAGGSIWDDSAACVAATTSGVGWAGSGSAFGCGWLSSGYLASSTSISQRAYERSIANWTGMSSATYLSRGNGIIRFKVKLFDDTLIS